MPHPWPEKLCQRRRHGHSSPLLTGLAGLGPGEALSKSSIVVPSCGLYVFRILSGNPSNPTMEPILGLGRIGRP